MSTFHRRIVVMNYIPTKLPKFATAQQHTEYLKTLGYMMDYRINRDQDEDTIQIVRCTLSDEEIFCQYPKPLPEFNEKWEDGTTKVIGSNFDTINKALDHIEAPRTGHVFTMAAINRGDEWSTHS